MMLFLQGHGVSAAYSTRIYKTYGQEAVKIVQENPYRLAQDVRGIGFITADKIARQMGIDEHSPHRAQAALEHLLLEQADEGHVFTPNGELVQMCQSRFDLPEDLLTEAVAELAGGGPDHAGWRGRSSYGASILPSEPWRIPSGPWRPAPGSGGSSTPRLAVDWASRLNGNGAEPGEQRQAVHEAVSQKVFVLTGGPGTGKTTILRAVISILEVLGQRVALAAPTGRAAKRLGEAAGREAQTLHRLLEFKPGEGRFGRNAERAPGRRCRGGRRDLDAGHRAVPPSAAGGASPHLGAVRWRCEPTALRWTRQVPWGRSRIRSCAFPSSGGYFPSRGPERHRRGQPTGSTGAACPSLGSSDSLGDFYFVDARRTGDASQCRGPHLRGADPGAVRIESHEGRPGIVSHEPGGRRRSPTQRQAPGGPQPGGDRGNTLRTDFPGGRSCAPVGQQLRQGCIQWRSGLGNRGGPRRHPYHGWISREPGVEYDFSELDELQPSFAMTVHRAQGSEFPAVVVPVLTQHYPMLQRNLLYTAITRGRRLVVIVGSSEGALAMAVRNDRPGERNSMLGTRLSGTETGSG